MEEMITAAGINKKEYFAPDEASDLLKDVYFTIHKHEFAALTGQSGCGKTMLLRILSGLEKDFEGTVVINGTDMGNMDGEILNKFRSENIGCCLAPDRSITSGQTIIENLESKMNRLDIGGVQGDLYEILEAFNLTSVGDQTVLSCSPNNYFRLLLALAFVGWPPVVLIDEIPDYFPAENRNEILNILFRLQRRHGITMILATHDTDIMKRADTALFIKDEKVYKIDMQKLRTLTNI